MSSPPHLYALPPDRPFLTALARGLLFMAEGDPLRLARMTVLLPTRRAVRSLREAFLRLTGDGGTPGATLLLPRLRPIGDLDADEIALGLDGADDPTLAIPPAIPELRRRLLLTRLVLGWSEAKGEHSLLPGQAAALAAALARLLDQVATEGASFARLRELAPGDLAEHWETVLDFLDILPNAWPAIIVEAGLRVTFGILLGAALSFLGLGAQPPSSDWGLMISEGRASVTIAPWVSIFPGLAMLVTVIGFNLLGGGLRDALDPRIARDYLH